MMTDTYRAKRYPRTRTEGRAHACPQAGPLDPHNLIPAPDEPGMYVCPLQLSVERGAKILAAEEAEAERDRQARAEQIAATIRRNNGHALIETHPVHGTDLQRMLTAAALAAMTEREATR